MKSSVRLAEWLVAKAAQGACICSISSREKANWFNYDWFFTNSNRDLFSFQSFRNKNNSYARTALSIGFTIITEEPFTLCHISQFNFSFSNILLRNIYISWKRFFVKKKLLCRRCVNVVCVQHSSVLYPFLPLQWREMSVSHERKKRMLIVQNK